MEDCIFCKIVAGEIPSTRIYEDDRVFAFADINPITDGHTLIIPKAHAENIFEMSADDMAAVARAAKKLAHAIQTALNPDGIACLQLNGKGVNQLVMHYHYHLIPRPEGGPELTMTQWELKPGDMAAISATADRIIAALTE